MTGRRLLAALALAASLPAVAEPDGVIFDTDMQGDYDDVGALAILHALADAGELKILATVSSTRGNASVGAIEVINAYYGRPDLPVGAPKGGGICGADVKPGTPKVDPNAPLEPGWGGHAKYRRLIRNYAKWCRHADADDAPDATEVYRRALAGAPDGSVVVCTVGFLTNVRRLVESGPDALSPLSGRELVARKVKRWVLMGFTYPRGKSWNTRWDAESSRIATEGWPTPIEVIDWQCGYDTFAGRAVAELPGEGNPVKDIFAASLPSRAEVASDPAKYHAWGLSPYGQSAWDEVAVLAIIHPEHFNVNRGWYRMVGTDGENAWIPDERNGRHIRYTEKVSKHRVGRLIDELMCRPPKSGDPAGRLLTRWCDGLIGHQLVFPGDRGLDGAMACSACAYLHGRIGDTVYPFVVQWARTGDERYLTAARKAVGWCEANVLCSDGSYMNDLKTHWNYITVFSQIAIGKTLRTFGPRLPADFRGRLEAIYARQSRWLYDCFRQPKTAASVEVNYWGNQAEAMAEAGVRLGEPMYTAQAREIVDTRLKRLFAEDGMLMGEIVPSDHRSETRGLAAVDLGYNLEETLPAMLAAAEVLGDRAFEDQVVASAKAHLEFLLPDGAIDDTAGSRGYKWTYAGSRTADGVLPLLAKLDSRGVRWARRAAERVVALHGRLTGSDGLLYGGLYYRDAGEPACLHHTFTHAKGLAEYLSLVGEAVPSADGEPMPRELTDRLVRRPSMGAELAAVGPWRATFSVSDAYVLKDDARRLAVGGGSPTLLWHERAGLVLAATQADFFFLETTNQQETRRERDILSTTPRLETADGFTNVQDFGVTVTSGLTDGVYAYSVRGALTSLKGEKGAPFEVDYRLTADGLSVRAKAGCACRYYLPVVGGNDTEITVSGNRATVRRNSVVLDVTASAPLKTRLTERGRRSFTTIGGLMSEHLYVDLTSEATLAIKVL